ncbi:multi antimicrobial extrusion protein (Na(+)/drug antiporter), MATE family of MDR efflux pumps [Lachnospiraceae bacterium KM106-2]|nr:multi antimicrobial extrusion protein (Na(+)/drug antiporter), MATE family of MDR efflux pumps [Lachnospiraceae bacterium KM106-2]
MKKQMDLLRDPIKPLFLKYLLPSVSATLVTSIYVLADTIIVGKGIGATAVAALNIVLPLFSLFFGTGLLFGVGGSVLLSLNRGKGEYEKANRYFSTAVCSAAIFAILYLLLITTGFESVAKVLGATKATMPYAKEYSVWLLAGIPFFIGSSLLQAFIRNDKAPKLAMTGVVTGGVLNIILDYIFVMKFGWGMTGAASATFIGSFTTVCILLTHFLSKKNTLKLRVKEVKIRYISDIVKTGFSSFLVEMSNGIVVFIFNLQLVHYIGDIGITVYSILSNTAIVVMSLTNGISQAAQPIITENFGARNMERIHYVKRIAFITACIMGGFFVAVGVLMPNVVIDIFIHRTDEIMKLAPTAIQIYFVSFIGLAANMFLSNYYQATLRPFLALLICMLRGVIFCIIFVYILPIFLGVNGIWLTMPLSEAVAFVIAILLGRKYEVEK